MRDSVSVRGRNRNVAPVFHVLGSRIVDADRLELAVRGEFDGDLAAAQRHARIVAKSIAERFGGPARCDINDEVGLPIYSATAGGAS